MIPEFTGAGLLPVGRFQCTMDEAQAAFVDAPRFAESTTRADVWNRIQALLQELAALRARVPSMFLSGSFTTATLDPADGDISPLIDVSRIQSDGTWRAVSELLDRAKPTLHLDVLPVFWVPEALGSAAALAGSPQARQYVCDRGRWDDFWQRYVPKLERDPFARAHAFPKRGYVEVIVDGYR